MGESLGARLNARRAFKIGRPCAAYPVEPTQIARERAQGASWGSWASKDQVPRTSVRRLYQNGFAENGEGTGRTAGAISRAEFP